MKIQIYIFINANIMDKHKQKSYLFLIIKLTVFYEWQRNAKAKEVSHIKRLPRTPVWILRLPRHDGLCLIPNTHIKAVCSLGPGKMKVGGLPASLAYCEVPSSVRDPVSKQEESS